LFLIKRPIAEMAQNRSEFGIAAFPHSPLPTPHSLLPTPPLREADHTPVYGVRNRPSGGSRAFRDDS
ncbi:MAG: hypothetical protein MUF49_29245, partial [Oculatellaceae cyanobacterium Prado106]|nr:hypothetical protein [Oculatellaceae cyanobacterium Prado106]